MHNNIEFILQFVWQYPQTIAILYNFEIDPKVYPEIFSEICMTQATKPINFIDFLLKFFLIS